MRGKGDDSSSQQQGLSVDDSGPVPETSGLDWTGRQIRKDKTARIPDECAAILERLECNAETWLDFVKDFRKRFRNEAGLPQNRQRFRFTRRQTRWASGVS